MSKVDPELLSKIFEGYVLVPIQTITRTKEAFCCSFDPATTSIIKVLVPQNQTKPVFLICMIHHQIRQLKNPPRLVWECEHEVTWLENDVVKKRR